MTRKNNSPSPTSYKCTEAYEKSCGSPANDKSGRYYKIGTGARMTHADLAMKSSKKTPGVGRYDSHTALDKCSRPMVSYKN